ncbi:hypothetical protein RUND412_011555, partial [Rhizina undulata]
GEDYDGQERTLPLIEEQERIPVSGLSFSTGHLHVNRKRGSSCPITAQSHPRRNQRLYGVLGRKSIPVPSLHKPENKQSKETNLLDDPVPDDRSGLASKALDWMIPSWRRIRGRMRWYN